MNARTSVAAVLIALTCVSRSAPVRPGEQPGPTASSAGSISSIVKVGEIYQLETSAPLIDGPDRVTVAAYGPGSWVLVDYEASVLTPGETKPTPRKSQMWINFDHVVAARRISPANQ